METEIQKEKEIKMSLDDLSKEIAKKTNIETQNIKEVLNSFIDNMVRNFNI